MVYYIQVSDKNLIPANIIGYISSKKITDILYIKNYLFIFAS